MYSLFHFLIHFRIVCEFRDFLRVLGYFLRHRYRFFKTICVPDRSVDFLDLY